MRRIRLLSLILGVLLFASASLIAQSNCPRQTHASTDPASQEAIPPFIGPGSPPFSPNQSLCLPQLAPTPTGLSPLAFVVQGVEPGDRVDSQGTVYVGSIRGVPGGVDLWRWYAAADGGPNPDGTLPFKYEGQPDNCGIYSFAQGGCANNVGTPTNLGIALGGGDIDIAANSADPNTGVPNLALTSLTLAPGVTATRASNRGDSFTLPNPVSALIPGDDRQWNDAIDSKTVYLAYHDLATFNIDVQRSQDGGFTYDGAAGEAIDPATFPAAGNAGATATANLAARITVDLSGCSSRGNVYQLFVAPDNATENILGQSMRSAYIGVSRDAKVGMPVFMFTDHKVYTGPVGAVNGNIFPAMAVDGRGYLYATWSDNSNIFFSSSSDQGTTWTTARVINQAPTLGNANVFPWVAADANGHVVVVWLGADKAGNSNDRTAMEPDHTEVQNGACTDGTTTCMTKWAKWNVYVAETVNGHDSSNGISTAAFTQYQASDHVIHRGSISTGGFGGSPDRNLADYFQVALDAQHRANISFADDHIVSPLSMSRTGTADPDNPVSFRVGVPYFTYRLQPPAGIVTDGSCASGETQQEDEAEGDDGHGDHVDSVDQQNQNQQDNGTIHYHDSSLNLDLRSFNGVQSITYNGSCVSFTGDARVNGVSGYQFNFSACDLSASGGIGNFSISLTGPGGFSYQKDATFTSGFVKLHRSL